jgi:hypothetical protein
MPYQSVIGILRWAVELGRVDITTEVSMLLSHLCPVTDTLLVLCIFAYLEKKHNARMVFDPTYPVVDKVSFRHDWKDFCNVKERSSSTASLGKGGASLFC